MKNLSIKAINNKNLFKGLHDEIMQVTFWTLLTLTFFYAVFG